MIPAARGRGLGRLVLDLVEVQARELGLAALFLVVDPDNAPARRLYDRQGFAGTHWLLMAKRL
jgi:ribosomal protein S18 acetylase RimI-like enzyme